jgi:dTDP-4-dehydrorhamnose 3,5-epimerase
MEIKPSKLKGCFLISKTIHSDNRGYFIELFQSSKLEKITGQLFQPVQTNLSFSHSGTVRGIHFSTIENGQNKLVSCVSGRVNDYLIDLRRESTSFGKWEKIELTQQNGISIYIESGFGHAFQAMEDNTIVVYHVDTEYSESNEKSISIYDNRINLKFDKPVTHLSDKDMNAPDLSEIEKNGNLPNYPVQS